MNVCKPKAQLFYDGLHLTSQGSQILGQAINTKLIPFIGKTDFSSNWVGTLTEIKKIVRHQYVADPRMLNL